MSLVQLSVEEYISRPPIDSNDIQGLLALNEIPSNECDGFLDNNICSPWDLIDFIDPKNCGIEKNGFDLYLPGIASSKGDAIDDICQLVFNYDIPQPCEELALYLDENAQVELKSNNIPLSQSVGVTLPKNLSHSIQIVHNLEPTYKPRYKSDYFSQYGTVRKPRYVADEKGNHFVTLKVVPGIQGKIRIDWVTIPTDKKIRYSMPYKFQISNESPDVPDCNPVYINIDADGAGIMKLYLVLIKAKQDQLKNIQSLQLFPPFENGLEMKQMPPLSPKTLIRNYQLDKSQLALTFCSLSPDGKSYIPEWDTTIYSTVLTEISVDASKKRTITCPRCMHLFDITVDGADDIGHEKPIKKRKKIVLDKKKNKLQKK